jgi:hypothetical protein
MPTGWAPSDPSVMTVQNLSLRIAGRPDRDLVSIAGAIAAASIFAAAGLVFVALGAAFPLALAVVESQQLAVAATDVAVAERIAPFWWVFVSAGVVNFAAAFAAPQRRAAGQRVAEVVAASGVALAAAAGIAFAMRGEPGMVAPVVAVIYLVALVAAIVVERRAA